MRQASCRRKRCINRKSGTEVMAAGSLASLRYRRREAGSIGSTNDTGYYSEGLHEMYCEVVKALASDKVTGSEEEDPDPMELEEDLPPLPSRAFFLYSELLPCRFASRAFPYRYNFVNMVSSGGQHVRMKICWRVRNQRSTEAFLTKGWKSFLCHHGLRSD
ncbi:hypothetical protein PIB30_047316, partial [Stylosanthes scabra]|nr:hypothetical protein [Stylosanthes scabra]